MSSHADTEVLSAYLDRELGDAEAQQVEQHLADCQTCQERFAGMRSVVAGLRHLERMGPPPTLDQVVARRVKLEGAHTPILDRLEGNFGNFERQSHLLGLFGLIIALAIFILLFAQAVDQYNRDGLLPVIFHDPQAVTESRHLAERTFKRDGEIWIEQGVDMAPARVIPLDSAAWRALLAAHPELAELAELSRPVVLRIGDEVLRLEPRSEIP